MGEGSRQGAKAAKTRAKEEIVTLVVVVFDLVVDLDGNVYVDLVDLH